MLGKVAEIIMGQSPKAIDVNIDRVGLPLLNGPTEFGPNHPTPSQYTTNASKVCREGDLLFCVRGSTTGRMNWADQPYAIGRGIAAIRHRKHSSIQPFLRAVIEHGLDDLLVQATGSTFPNISSSLLNRVNWPLIDEHAQQNASAYLSILDEQIDLLREMNTTLEDIARSLFRAWFVDFEPVRAKAAGANSFQGMPQELFDVLPASFEGSEVGEIPKGWAPCELSELIEVNPKRILKKGTEAVYLGMSDVPTNGPTAESWAIRDYGSGMRFRNGDTLLARITPCLENGKTALVDFLEGDGIAWGSTEFIVMAPKNATPREFIYCLARNERFRQCAIKNMTGTSGRQRVSHQAISSYNMATPSRDLLQSYGALTKPMFERISANRDEINTLSNLRDALLPKLISGEIEAPDLEALADGE